MVVHEINEGKEYCGPFTRVSSPNLATVLLSPLVVDSFQGL